MVDNSYYCYALYNRVGRNLQRIGGGGGYKTAEETMKIIGSEFDKKDVTLVHAELILATWDGKRENQKVIAIIHNIDQGDF